MRCINCGQPLIQGAKFCGKCGTPVSAVPTSGTIDDTSEYRCEGPHNVFEEREQRQRSAGSSVESHRSIAPDYMSRKRMLKKKRGGGNATLVLGLLIALLAIVALAFWFVRIPTSDTQEGPGPEETVARLEKALDSLDTDAIAECFDPASRDGIKRSLNSELEQYNNILKVLGFAVDFDLEIEDVTYTDEDHCTVALDTTVKAMGKKSATSADMQMVREGDTWYVDGSNNSDLFSQMGSMF